MVSEETARNLRRMLQKVVLKGTGKRAALNGYTSAGKTGTAWKFDPKTKRVSSEKYVASFVGMAPVENPSVVIAVVMDEPRAAARNGGDVSAPVFREIAGDLPDYLDPRDESAWERTILDYASDASPARAAQMRRIQGFTPPNWDQHFAQVEKLLRSLG